MAGALYLDSVVGLSGGCRGVAEEIFVHVLMVRSRHTLYRAVIHDLGELTCDISFYCSKGGTGRLLKVRGCSLILLSLGLPNTSKVAMLQALQRASGSAKILVLSTHYRITSGIRRLSTKTGSCLAGPFRLRRLRTEVHDLAHQQFARGGIILGYKGITFSAGTHITITSNRRLSLAQGRVKVLRCLLLGRNHPIDRRRLLSRI